VSSAAGTGVEELKEYLWKLVEDTKATAGPSDQNVLEAEEEV
jgi:hypothetical protein